MFFVISTERRSLKSIIQCGEACIDTMSYIVSQLL